MIRNFLSLSGLILTMLILPMLVSCYGGHDGHESGEKADNKKHHDHIVMTHEAEHDAGIVLDTVHPGQFRDVVKASGVIENTRTGERVITAPAGGVVTFNGNLVAGAQVAAGQSLFSVSSKGMEQSEAAAVAKVNLDLARRQLERGEALLKDNLITRRDYEQLRADVASAEAVMSAVSTRSAAGAVGISSPMGGYLVSVDVAPGSFVNMGDRLAVVSQSRRIMLRADVSERKRREAGSFTGANIQMPGSDEVYDLQALNCRVVTDGVPDASNSHYVPVFIEFDNPGGLYSGTPVETWLLGPSREGVISVPVDALVEEGGVYSVFVNAGHCEYARRRVVTGASDGRRVEILEGLRDGDAVVVKGALSVRMAGMGNQIQGHTHKH